MTRTLIVESLVQSFRSAPPDTEVKTQGDSTLTTTENIQTNFKKEVHAEIESDQVTTKVYQHLQDYPIARSYFHNVNRLPQPHFVRKAIHDALFSDRLVPFTVRLDTSLNNLLDQLDQQVPQVKTLRMRDIRDVFTGPLTKSYTSLSRYSSKLSSSTNREVSRVIVKPTRTMANHVIDVYNHEKATRPGDTLSNTISSSIATSRKLSSDVKNSFQKI